MKLEGDEVSGFRVALAGNPNCGKTTIFNALTGAREAVGNYSGVTVEKVEAVRRVGENAFQFVDLPGVYSLTTFSKDETVARNFLLRERPDAILNVVDASNLARNLFLTLQLKELGIPLVVVLNMGDLAKARGRICDPAALAKLLGVPVVEVVGVGGKGVDKLLATLNDALVGEANRNDSNNVSKVADALRYSAAVEAEIERVESVLNADLLAKEEEKKEFGDVGAALGALWLKTGFWNGNSAGATSDGGADERSFAARRRWIAIKLLEDDQEIVASWNNSELASTVSSCVARLATGNVPVGAKLSAERYAIVQKICKIAVRDVKAPRVAFSDRLDSVLTRPFLGSVVFFAAMYLVFWLTFALGNIPVGWLEAGIEWLTATLNEIWRDSPDSLLRSMLVDGIVGGVGGVLVFFPNIFILFAAISALEESGYMARGAFLTDRFLSKFGLRGKSFIPMLVGFGCSVPGILATRVVDDRRARLTTIFVVPLMSCGARFPIYVLIIPAFFASKWQAPILWGVYFAGILLAVIVAKILSWTTFRGERAPMLIELPTYRAPTFQTVGVRALERGWQYLRKAGTTILGVSLILWTASTFPTLSNEVRDDFSRRQSELAARAETLGVDLSQGASSETVESPEVAQLREKWRETSTMKAEARLENSVAGRVGKTLEPISQLGGFDWRIGTALIGALAAKEVFVAQLGIVFKVGENVDDPSALQETFAKNYSPLVGICVIIFCLVGAPCVATFAVVAKEISFGWAFTQWASLTALGFALSVLTFQLGTWLQLGV